jgi:hypothetical protein
MHGADADGKKTVDAVERCPDGKGEIRIRLVMVEVPGPDLGARQEMVTLVPLKA